MDLRRHAGVAAWNVLPPNAKAATAPTADCYDNAVHHKALVYESVTTT